MVQMSLSTTEQSFSQLHSWLQAQFLLKVAFWDLLQLENGCHEKIFGALPFLINKRKEKHPHNNGMKFHVQVRDIGSDQDNGIAMLSFANLLGLLPCQVKD